MSLPIGRFASACSGRNRGRSLARSAKLCGLKLVAVCDHFKARLDAVCKDLEVDGYEDFDTFIQQDFDAVIVASCFHQHAPFAKKALLAGKHVLSETSTNNTLREGVELYRMAEESGLCYMLAENYCYTRFVQEMKRLYEADEIGECLYAEGEYNHPLSPREHFRYMPGLHHWRAQHPSCYYITHALSPLMYITGTVPREVSCSLLPPKAEGGKNGYVALVRMSNGAIFRIFAGVAGHSCAYGMHGTHGAMESVHGHGYFGPQTLRVWHEPWDVREGQCEDAVYLPNWPSHGDAAEQSGQRRRRPVRRTEICRSHSHRTEARARCVQRHHGLQRGHHRVEERTSKRKIPEGSGTEGRTRLRGNARGQLDAL